jgi:hypothetical protein
MGESVAGRTRARDTHAPFLRGVTATYCRDACCGRHAEGRVARAWDGLFDIGQSIYYKSGVFDFAHIDRSLTRIGRFLALLRPPA